MHMSPCLRKIPSGMRKTWPWRDEMKARTSDQTLIDDGSKKRYAPSPEKVVTRGRPNNGPSVQVTRDVKQTRKTHRAAPGADGSVHLRIRERLAIRLRSRTHGPRSISRVYRIVLPRRTYACRAWIRVGASRDRCFTRQPWRRTGPSAVPGRTTGDVWRNGPCGRDEARTERRGSSGKTSAQAQSGRCGAGDGRTRVLPIHA